MISPRDIKQKALRFWEQGRLFEAELSGQPLFPLDISFKKPAGRALQENFGAIQDWLDELRGQASGGSGPGYSLEFSEINNHKVGLQSLPSRIFFANREDFLGFIGKGRDFTRFQELTAFILERRPGLREWLGGNSGRILDQAENWERLLGVCDFLEQNPRPDIYIRELTIPGVDTKFVEGHRKILGDLLDVLLPEDAVNGDFTGISGRNFEKRFGFKYDLPVIRFRLLDHELKRHFQGAGDISLPLPDFAALHLELRRVFITENKTNGLAFPDMPGALVIFGLGYGVNSLRDVDWLREQDVFYWGDIDTHGFGILSRLREFLPHTNSLLMNEKTLLDFQGFWGQEEEHKRCLEDLPNLRDDEARLFDALRSNSFGRNLRLEQEKIGFDALLAEL